MQIRLNDEEATVLRELLEEYLSDLRMEISHTDLLDYRDRLRRKQVVIHALLDRLPAPVAPV
ncbi:MAG: hypothetical protein PVF68_06910 [Acidobacteriota bacterium]|jgi:hypothetical protein